LSTPPSQALPPADLLAHRRPASAPAELAAALLAGAALLAIQAARLLALDVDDGLHAVQLVDVAGHGGVGGGRVGLVEQSRHLVAAVPGVGGPDRQD
jgi:hypothetical protein